MISMFCQSIEVSLKTGPDICDVTSALNALIRESGIENGQLSAAIVGSTGSLTTIEFEPGVVEDLKRAIFFFSACSWPISNWSACGRWPGPAIRSHPLI